MRRICVFGAGNIGCYVGGRLAAVGADVTFIGRDRLRSEVLEHGLRISDLHGADVRVDEPRFETDPAAAADSDLVLVTVKSAASAEVGAQLAPVLAPAATIVSFQNGLSNASVLGGHLGRPVLAGMVPFNVVRRAPGWYHQGSEGHLEVARAEALDPYAEVFERAGLPLTQHDDMDPVLWAKLMLNLNNPINALSGAPLRDELSRREFRTVLSLAQQELLAVGRAAGLKPARLTPLPPALIPRLLRLPDAVFRRTAQSMLAIDPLARSSMWDDLEAERATEVDWISGEVCRLGRDTGVPTPVNDKLVELVRAAESGGRRAWSGPELLSAVRGSQPASKRHPKPDSNQ